MGRRSLWVSVAALVALLASLPAPAEAAKSGTCAAFKVIAGRNDL
jgi:hypothetical protein